MEYERAAILRDRIRTLTSIQAKQDINFAEFKNTDVISVAMDKGKACVQVFFFRSGQNYGNRAFFPKHTKDESPEDILGAFIAQFYENKMPPREIVISHDVCERLLLEEALTSRAEYSVKITVPQKGKRKDAVSFVMRNARTALSRHLIERAGEEKIIEALCQLFSLDEPPKRIEIYDNSHISGTDMVGAMVVAGPDGFQKNAYRKFNIKTADESDDYGMMREVIHRRFSRALKEDPHMSGEGWPDLILIDGGKGQLSSVLEILEDLGIKDAIAVVSIAKGEDRNAGRETFFMAGRPSFQLPVNDALLHYLQRLRDEAHRFAIGAHRAKRQGKLSSSPLDNISGVGGKRKKALLHYFGSAKSVAGASVEDLAKVEGISKAMAQKIYDHFHE